MLGIYDPKKRDAVSDGRDVIFDDDAYRSRVVVEHRRPTMVAWVVRLTHGMVKTERQATLVLLGIALIFAIAAYRIFASGLSATHVERNGKGLTPQETEQYRKIQPF